MPSCNKCQANFNNIKSLIVHLRLLHGLTDNSKFCCNEFQCYRDFNSLNSFKKHLSKKHGNHRTNSISNTIAINSINIPITNIIETSSLIDHSSTTDTSKTQNMIIEDNLLLEFQNELKNNTLLFVTDLYGNTTLTRKHVQCVIDKVETLFEKPLRIFETYLSNVISEYNISEKDSKCLNKFLHEFQNTFQSLATEHKRFAFLEKSELFIPPEAYTVGQRYDRFKNNIATPQIYKAQHIPIHKVLKHFILLPNVLLEVLQYLEELNSELVISNIVQTEFWKNKIKGFESRSLVLPLFVYFDEYESGNPLGSHSGIHKLGAVYFSLPFLPIRYRAKLENIFLCLLFHSSDLKDFGSKIIFSKLIEDCNHLESSGITVNISNKYYTIYFSIALLLGDNLGLNTMLGFTQSFRSNYYCRFCKCSRVEMEKLVIQCDNKMRNQNNYRKDVHVNNISETGIKEECVFNTIKSFHVTENYSVDISHDIFEGVAAYDIAEILYQFVFVDKILSVEIINTRIKYFNYGKESNKPPLISLENLKKKKLRMSCAEMKCFILYGGLLLGAIVPEDNQFWKLYLLLRKIIDLVLADVVTNETCCLLKDLIAKHHSLYKELFNTTLKPKYHNLVHYPFIMKQVGPLKHLSSLRFESKHRESKLSANVIASRINITYSLALKHQLKLVHRLNSKQGFSNSINYKNSNPTIITSVLPNFNMLESTSTCSFNNFKDDVKFCKKIEINNSNYEIGSIICIAAKELPIFGCITHIIVNSQEEICFIYEEYKTILFNKHIHSFEICTNTKVTKRILDSNVCYTSNLIISSASNKKYVTLFGGIFV
ncbi:uncharacterized protein LOC116182914 isoform X1 [Photinus pyralis]|uniref:C2H2-type domain-containing protein n=2 Tax=Photinus pyralis TaxID=7054 RepID=A0A1Y1KF20_PHOPY|nr:uncharacterized protein LOC116181973 isoform X1 [Photinus pyralis]XP_031358302.1 uncharacterized protein LOC116181973 isoform X1 [Photinus pyralis]XP_031359333.1 uncharacterized protein LOC116182914 isoform X1 [Photinus pyralis]XP_031359334.1 uncharacterized protein LOC116182914 isoform X1 [Photinus pyralis]XP_031359335.1 uncharacterized protein LOC116182914 isoform X1 [Photinus pyralis]XP_031359336.1 uncharacterized protein LOC116182914 isoform X1 [Photinus pyralis]